jgi:choice-of-anchor B domain-containing protein
MKRILLIILAFYPILGFTQVNLDSVSHVNFQVLHDTYLNDVWGYVDETGIEYALVGARKGTSVVSLATPENPVEVFWEPGMESIWRDLKTWQNHAYITTEAENGLLILDLSPLPGSNAIVANYYNGPVGSEWSSAHNLYIDSSGYAYIFGANRGNGGVIILDVHTDPANPAEIGTFDNWYVHDGYVRNDTMFLAHISDGFLSMVDVTDRTNPILLGTKTTPSNFTHNIWPTNDGNVAFTTDEVSGGYLGSYDVSDPLNIIELDRIQSSPGQGVIPHNVHVDGNFLITSYYSDGVTVHDITHPNNMILVGQYDTYPAQTTSYDGCWGAYPFLPSGLILGADITEGLFILNPNYVQAAYLEGLITDAASLNPLPGVKVTINGHDQSDYSISNGDYATGILAGGSYSVTYSKVGYFSQTISVSLVNSVVTIQDVQLIPIPPFNVTVNVVEFGTGAPISNAQILLAVPLIDHLGNTNGIGQEDFVLFYQENYFITVGKWGYFTKCFDQVLDQNTGQITVILEKGYQDEFTFDFGWTTSGTAVTGSWERGKPNGSSSGSAPSIDSDLDCGVNCFVTGNDMAQHPDSDDVDGGFTLLTSPTMDLTSYSDPHLFYRRWFYCEHGAPPNDTLKVAVSNGFTTVVLDEIGAFGPQFYQWVPRSFRLSDYLTITNSMQVLYLVSDFDPDVNITEAGVDYFLVTNTDVLDIAEENKDDFQVFPNPFATVFTIQNAEIGAHLTVFNAQGVSVHEQEVKTKSVQLELPHVPSGLYFIKINNQVKKIMKH